MTTTLARSYTIIAAAVLAFAATPVAPLQAGARESARIERAITIPAGTVLRVRVDRGFGSDASRVEDPVHATLAQPVILGGDIVVPAGSAVSGYISDAQRPGRVKGRGRVAVRFTALRPSGDDDAYRIRTSAWTAIAPATKKKDALTIGLPAAGGAIVGGLVGGKKGAGIGALTGGGAGTAVVLSTRGRDVRVGPGATLRVRLTAPVTIHVLR
jgi:hypothetical protein